MISLEKSPEVAREAIRLFDERALFFENASGLYLPEHLANHPVLDTAYDIMPSDDPSFTPIEELPLWGAVHSTDPSKFMYYLTDNIEDTIRPHMAAILSLVSFGEDPRLVREALIKAYDHDEIVFEQLCNYLVRMTMTIAPSYENLPSEYAQAFHDMNGLSIKSHRERVRAIGGEAIAAWEIVSGYGSAIRRQGFVESRKLLSEVPYDKVTDKIGRPYVFNPREKIESATLSQEPTRPRKPHTCGSCRLHVASDSMRLTTQYSGGGLRDHRHYHAICV